LYLAADNPDDCDGGAATASPDAAEIRDDGLDSDCDGTEADDREDPCTGRLPVPTARRPWQA